jgi:hypothetical protein
MMSRTTSFVVAVLVVSIVAGCRRVDNAESTTPVAESEVAKSLPMGGEKSVTKFFITSRGTGNGAISVVWRAPTRIVRCWRKRKERETIPGVPTSHLGD